MGWPTDDLNTTDTDQGTDNPGLARSMLNSLILKVKEIIAARGAIDGVADLDATGKVPMGRLLAGVASGLATLDGAGQVPTGQLPALNYAPDSHVGAGGVAEHPAATTSVAGFLSAADKQKLDGITPGATVGNEVVVLSGTIAHSGTISLPNGYSEAQCKWIVSMKEVPTVAPGPFQCYTTGRVVTAQYWDDPFGSFDWRDGTAHYLIIGVK
ncbi:MAG: hypothetical protein JMN25_15825 [gamma proteobacterium endosymbiont of Lamellibrachia anaximandri]|nr:hypothetical protein [gamma proteobacterium endosymbiont of Lamellibrachia anaximandri]